MIFSEILICTILQCSAAFAIKLGMAKAFPAIPRTGQVVTFGPPSVSPISSHRFSPKENHIKAVKTGTKFEQLRKIDGNAQQSSPMFIRILSKNLSNARMVMASKAYPGQPQSGNVGKVLRKQTTVRRYSDTSQDQLNRTLNEEEDMKIENPELIKVKIIDNTPCIRNRESQKVADLKKYLRFWDYSSDLPKAIDSTDISHTSTINRICATAETSMFCCKEIARNVEDFVANNTNLCGTSQKSIECREFCISNDLETAHSINSTEYFCQEKDKQSISMPAEQAQSVLFNKTSFIIFGQHKNAQNPEFRSWARQMLRNLDVSLALDNEDNNSTGSSSSAILLSQWIEFPESEETTTGQQTAWQLLQEYQQYDENFSNNLIRICVAKQDKPQKIDCTEQYHHNMCLLDDPDGCMGNMLTVQMSVICRYFSIQGKKIVESTDILCESLNESTVPGNSLREISESATSILLLQLTHTKIIHSIAKLGQYNRSENVNKNWQKHANGVKLKNEGRTGTAKEMDRFKTQLSEDLTIEDRSPVFRTTEYQSVTVNSGSTATWFSEIANNSISGTGLETTSGPSIDTAPAMGTTSPTIMFNTTVLEILKNSDENLKSTINATVSNEIDETNATVEFQVRVVGGAERNTVTDDDIVDRVTRKEPPVWEPFHMDCSVEKDEFNISSCSDWAAAGYCLSNNATRFLWCRKTCLCVGPPQL